MGGLERRAIGRSRSKFRASDAFAAFLLALNHPNTLQWNRKDSYGWPSARMKSTSHSDSAHSIGMLPATPWSFPNARVLYQPSFLPVEVARDSIPNSGVTLLSLFGWTLGGVFIVEWTESPIGPYKEVAVLSGLVARGFSIGAWASHIVVTIPQAVESGREIFGLPAILGSIDLNSVGLTKPATTKAFELASAIALTFKTMMGAATPGVAEPAERLRPPFDSQTIPSARFLEDSNVKVQGWNAWSVDASSKGNMSISLPSFSGCLHLPSGKQTPLLRYPLRLGPACHFQLRPAMRVSCAPSDAKVSLKVRSIIESLRTAGLCPCIQVDRVQVVAGSPVVIDLGENGNVR